MQQVQHATRKQETGNSLYLNEPPLYQLLVSGKKAVIDLREDHLSRREVKRSEVRGGRWKQDRGEEEEEGKEKAETSVRTAGEPEPERRLQAGRDPRFPLWEQRESLVLRGAPSPPPPSRTRLEQDGETAGANAAGQTGTPGVCRFGVWSAKLL